MAHRTLENMRSMGVNMGQIYKLPLGMKPKLTIPRTSLRERCTVVVAHENATLLSLIVDALALRRHRVRVAQDERAAYNLLSAEEVHLFCTTGFVWFRRETVRRALTVAGIVGPILTVINQYDVLLRLEFSLRFWMKVLLTFLVPYCVSSFSSARAYMEQDARESALRDKPLSSQPTVHKLPEQSH